jgi:hypothetical protein
MEFQILDIFLPEFLLRRKENDIIGICSHHSGIAKNPFPIFHIVYCSYVEKLWNSVGIQIFCFSLHRDFLKVSVQYLWNSDQKWNSASKGGITEIGKLLEFPTKFFKMCSEKDI